jgi:hypothetical protein
LDGKILGEAFSRVEPLYKGILQFFPIKNHTYLATTNYWAPLYNEPADDKQPNQINNIKETQPIVTNKTNKWTRRIERRQAMKFVFDSGATSHFVSEEMNLPKKEKSDKEVFLPDNTKLQASFTTKLPFEQLSEKAREADILPGLKTPLISVNKMAEEGYTTIFHPGEEGVTIHKKGTVSITTTEPPKDAKLRTTLAHETLKEQAHNAYNLPSISQTVRYLHAAAGFPVRDTWIKAIKAGKYNTWPTIMPTSVRRHFPESDETQHGHMKQQRQGVRSTRTRIEDESNEPTLPKKKDVYVEIHNVSDTMHIDQTGRFPATSSRGNKYSERAARARRVPSAKYGS